MTTRGTCADGDRCRGGCCYCRQRCFRLCSYAVAWWCPEARDAGRLDQEGREHESCRRYQFYHLPDCAACAAPRLPSRSRFSSVLLAWLSLIEILCTQCVNVRSCKQEISSLVASGRLASPSPSNRRQRTRQRRPRRSESLLRKQAKGCAGADPLSDGFGGFQGSQVNGCESVNNGVMRNNKASSQ